MSFEPEVPELEPGDERTAALARDVLRATDVAGLDAAMRAQIAERAARRSQPRLWPLVLAAALGGALVVALGLYFGVVEPARLAEQQTRMQMMRLQAERQAEAERVAAERQVALEYARTKAEQAALAASQAEAQGSVQAEVVDDPAAKRPAAGGWSGGRAAHKSAAGPSGASGSSSSGCDPGDPLCGL